MGEGIDLDSIVDHWITLLFVVWSLVHTAWFAWRETIPAWRAYFRRRKHAARHVS